MSTKLTSTKMKLWGTFTQFVIGHVRPMFHHFSKLLHVSFVIYNPPVKQQ